MPTEKWPEIRNPNESFSIASHEEYLLDPSVQNISMGLGWSRYDASAVRVADFECE